MWLVWAHTWQYLLRNMKSLYLKSREYMGESIAALTRGSDVTPHDCMGVEGGWRKKGIANHDKGNQPIKVVLRVLWSTKYCRPSGMFRISHPGGSGARFFI